MPKEWMMLESGPVSDDNVERKDKQQTDRQTVREDDGLCVVWKEREWNAWATDSIGVVPCVRAHRASKRRPTHVEEAD